jgi:hypothetical protein
MALVLIMAGLLWGIGAVMGTPHRLRWGMIGLLWLAVVALHLVLPDGHSLRLATGESPAFGCLWAGLRRWCWPIAGLRRLRARAVAREAPTPQTGTFSEASLSVTPAIWSCGKSADRGRKS